MSQNIVNQPQKIIVLNDQREKLLGLLHDTGSKDVVIVCHGFVSSKENKMMVNICGALEKEGISAYRFDFSGNGESDGSLSDSTYLKEVEDLGAVVKYFKGTNRIVRAIVGHSKGGDVVLLYASKYHDICTVVNMSGRYDPKKGFAERFGDEYMEKIKNDGYIDVKHKTTGKVWYRVTEEIMMDYLSLDMHEASRRIAENCRVLTVHGSADEFVPVEDAYEFSKLIPNHKLHIIEGANHSFCDYQDALVAVVVDFIKSCIRMQLNIESSA